MASGGCSGCDDGAPSSNAPLTKIEREDQLIGGPEATGRIGDYLLQNEKARFVVQDAGSSTGWGLYGGSLVDVGVKGPGGEGDDRLQEIFVQCDLRAFEPTEAQIINDGADGMPAVLRMIGNDAGIPFLDAVITRDPLEVQITVDYILPPDSATLEIKITAKDVRLMEPREIACGVVFLRGDGYRGFIERAGADLDGLGGEQQYIAAAAWDAKSSYAFHKGEEKLNVVLGQLEIVPIAPDPKPLLANASVEERYFLSAGSGDVESALVAMRAHTPDAVARRDVQLSLQLPEPLEAQDAVFTMRDTNADAPGMLTEARPGADGVARFAAPPSDYEVSVELKGRFIERFTLTIPPGEGAFDAEHSLKGLGLITVRTVDVGLDGAERPAPGRIMLYADHDAPLGAGRVHQLYGLAEETFFMPPGPYTLVVSRGPEHELFSQNITVEASTEAQVIEAKIPRVVDTSGWVSADLHVHASRSPDSAAPMRSRVLGAAAEGVDVLIATDHDAVTDYRPLVESLDVGTWVRAVPGIEMSMLYGHMNGYPVPAQSPPTYYQPAWFVYEQGRFAGALQPHEVTGKLREMGAQVVQLNHPRDGQGVFNYIELDDATGDISRPWPEADTAEVLNGKRFEFYQPVLDSIHAVYRSGRRITAVGSSDTHSEFAGVGYARTYVRSEESAPDKLDLNVLWDGLRTGKAIAANGPFLTVTAQNNGGSAEIGDTLTGGGPVQISVQVQAPSWMNVANVRVLQGADTLALRELLPEDADPARPALRFTGTFTATPTADIYFMVEVNGTEGRQNPPLMKESRTVSNPIFVDVDGDGFRLP